MSFPGLAPPPPFLQTPGRPSLPWEEWEQTFTVYLLASGAAECPPERRARPFFCIVWGRKGSVFSGLYLQGHAPQHRQFKISLPRPLLTCTSLHSPPYGSSFRRRAT
ncbi:unnamed protein product [Ixodes pacificus]